MGTWTAAATARFEPSPVPNTFGHRFIVSLRLQHRAIPGEPLHRYAETPYLAWNEEITTKDYGTHEFFQWQGDLYFHKFIGKLDSRFDNAPQRFLHSHGAGGRKGWLGRCWLLFLHGSQFGATTTPAPGCARGRAAARPP